MPKLTKADIDGLVEGMPSACGKEYTNLVVGFSNASYAVSKESIRRELYLAAGLTAEGEPKPEKVRCWIGRTIGPDNLPFLIPDAGGQPAWRWDDRVLTPGWFVPDESLDGNAADRARFKRELREGLPRA